MSRLKELDIIRCIVILMLIAVHVTSPYTGAWPLPEGVHKNSTLEFINKFCCNGMLETFFFISGVLLATKSLPTGLKDRTVLLYKRFKRLYIPCIVFGIVAVILFLDGDIIGQAGRIISGVFHLWFLPVMFWCWVLEVLFVDRIKRHTLLLLAFISILPYPHLPLNFNVSLYYLFFFHLGCVSYRHKDRIYRYINNRNSIILLFLVAAVLFALKQYCNTFEYNEPDNLILKITGITLNRVAMLIASIPIIGIYMWLGEKLKKNNVIYNTAFFIAKYSLGIYILQELVIRFIYYKTDLCIVLPKVSTIITYISTIFISVVLTVIIAANKHTKKLVM